ncbi:MAG: helix-turn-helix transcriptional regulator [Candidatus Hydrogenedentes bacterium]|nr:helix-turn-helix transcriptional regulator [Candidatus Hydrogenedentota bacterium]
MTLAEKLKSLREEKKLSVADLATQSGVSKPYIWQIEDERRKNPTGEVLRKLASALGTTVPELMGAPAGITEDALADMPSALRKFVKRRGKICGLQPEDVEMLKHIHYRGKRPQTAEDYELVFTFLRRLLR